MGLPRVSIALASPAYSKIELTTENNNIPVKEFENENVSLVILGTPILGNAISYDGIWAEASNGALTPEFLKRINGEFLLIFLDKRSRTLSVSSDRFTSIPFFYTHDNSGFFGSVYYKELWAHLKQKNSLKINEHAVFEFLWLQRLLGTKTYDSSSAYLLAATKLTYSNGSISTSAYWTPSFKKTRSSISESAAQLATLFRQSIVRKTSDDPGRIGMFLSGGTDSRTILGSFEKPPVSFTLGVSDNNEVKVARNVANSAGSPHEFIKINADPYSAQLDDLAMLGGGMHSFDHGIFYGLEQQISAQADVMFHGHGVDYMFQGMYLLTRNLNFLGRQTSFKKLVSLPTDGTLAEAYVTQIGHRLKDVNLIDYVAANRREEMTEQLRHSVDEVLRIGEPFCENVDDQWEYMLIHALSRHYPFTNLTSMGSSAQQRTVTFDNDIFDLYLSLPKSHRLDGKIAKQTLGILSPELAAIPSANMNQRPNQSALSKDAQKLARSVRRRMGLERSPGFRVTAEERTWPDRGRMFATHPPLTKAAMDLRTSEALESLGFISMDRLANDIPGWLSTGAKGPGAFMTFLVTLDRFLKNG